MSKKPLCKLCRLAPATVPDRDRPGRLVNRVCGVCHAERLKLDLARLLERSKRPPPGSSQTF